MKIRRIERPVADEHVVGTRDPVGPVTADSPARGSLYPSVRERLLARIEQELLAAAPPIYAADLTGNLLFANAGYQELLQAAKRATGADAAGTPLVSPRVLDRVRDEHGTIEIDDSFEFDGTTRHFRSRHFPIIDDVGTLAAIGGIYQDVTRENVQHERIANTQERFDDITRLVSDWIWEVDKDFNFTFVSARVIEVFGAHPRLLLGSNLFDLGVFTEDGENSPDHGLRSPFRDKVFRIIGADGLARLCRLSGMPTFDASTGAFTGFRGTGNDITARVEAEERASRAQRQLSEAIDCSSEAFALFDASDRLVVCNSKFHEYHPLIADMMMPGVSYEALIRKGAEQGQFADAVGRAEGWIAQELERRLNPQGSYEQRLSDGRWLKVSDRRTGDGSTVCLRTDITELKRRVDALRRAEEASRTARETAEVANRSKSEFLANISHELRTPLNAIIGFSEVMMAEMFGAVGSPQYKEYVKDIHDSGTHLYNLINDILDVSKAEAGKLELNEGIVDVADAAARCIRLVNERADRAKVTIDANVPDDLPKLYADERKVKQILLNLLSNAVKFTPAGGKVSISAGVDTDGCFRVVVTDTGIGIAEKDIDKVMAPFGQVDSSLSRRYEGTGLGLPLTVSLVELHGGILDLKSEMNAGTKVTVRFPKERVREN
jgi:PAS domain S-box-containing protein